jgi:TonB family protein
MLFTTLALALQAFSPAQAGASTPATSVVAVCAHPNVEASVTDPVAPQLPHSAKVAGSASVTVTIAADGSVAHAVVSKSSGNAEIDAAVLAAAERSKYSPQVANCSPVQGTYVFLAQFKP